MAAGDPCASVLAIISPVWLYVKFTSAGTATTAVGDVIFGDTSAASATVEMIVLTSGSFAGGDAAGWMFLSNWNGSAWTSGENWSVGADDVSNDGTLTVTPVACGATPDTVNNVPVHDFDDTANEVVLVLGKLGPNYASGGITVKCELLGAAATLDISMGGAFRSFTDDTDNWLSTTFNAWGTIVYNTAIDAPTVIGEHTADTIAFTDGAQIDSLAAGELFLFALFRDAQDATNDDMTGDASLIGIEFTLT